jgi:hypothetical protein
MEARKPYSYGVKVGFLALCFSNVRQPAHSPFAFVFLNVTGKVQSGFVGKFIV